MVDLYEKVSSYMILGHMDQKFIFIDGVGYNFEFGPVEKKSWDFCEGHRG